jgi:sarcosine oxidase subunit alpha
MPEVGLTTFRAPYTPVTFGSLIAIIAAKGHVRGPTRKTPIHGWAEEQLLCSSRCRPMEARAWYFPRRG